MCRWSRCACVIGNIAHHKCTPGCVLVSAMCVRVPCAHCHRDTRTHTRTPHTDMKNWTCRTPMSNISCLHAIADRERIVLSAVGTAIMVAAYTRRLHACSDDPSAQLCPCQKMRHKHKQSTRSHTQANRCERTRAMSTRGEIYLWALVSVELDTLEALAVLICQLVNDGSDHAAWPTPWSL